MKVLMLGWELPPHNSGGLGVACFQMCKALARTGADIEFVLPHKYDHKLDFMKVTAAHPQDVETVWMSGIAYDSYKYTYADGHEEWVSIFDQQRIFEHSVEKLTKGRSFDIIHAHDWLTFRAGLRAKQTSGAPLILHVHSVEADRSGKEFGGNPLVREIEAMGFLMADRIIAVSQLTKDSIVREYGIPANKIEVVHNSIDVDDLEGLDPHNAYAYLDSLKSKGYRVVTNIGRLTIQKGLPNLLEAAKEVIARAPKTIFLLVGSGEQYHELIEKAANLGISKNVIFTGFQRGKNWRDSYAIADLFVMPSISEPFGLTPLEAINYGTPSLISKQSGVAEVLQNCLRVDFWDVSEMANQITAVMQNDSLRDELRHNANRELQRLSWDNAAEKLNRIYSQHWAGASV
ncbi:MAG: glycosyltransferase family 4 protein [Candidatus Saccharimonadales bacterium]